MISDNTKVLLTITNIASEYNFLFDIQVLIDVINKVNVKYYKEGVQKEDYDDMVFYINKGVSYFNDLDKDYMTDILNALLNKNKEVYLFDTDKIIKDNYKEDF